MTNPETLNPLIDELFKTVVNVFNVIKAIRMEKENQEFNEGFVWTDEKVKHIMAMYWNLPVADLGKYLDRAIDSYKNPIHPKSKYMEPNPKLQSQEQPANEDYSERPPLGVMPEWRWKELRFEELCEAVLRYQDGNKTIPPEWVAERDELAKVIRKRNQEKVQPEDKRDWEILSFRSTQKVDDLTLNHIMPKEGIGYRVAFDIKSLDEMVGNRELKIHSVRRLSDGEVFAVGDDVKVDDSLYSSPIKSFSINRTRIDVDVTLPFDVPLNDLEKSQPKPQSSPSGNFIKDHDKANETFEKLKNTGDYSWEGKEAAKQSNKQTAIAFAEWMDKNVQSYNHIFYYQDKIITIPELYYKFKKIEPPTDIQDFNK